MSPRLAAGLALVCTWIALGASAWAERRPVAVVDLSDLREGEQLAKDLGNALNNHAKLKPVDDPSMPALLLGRFVDEDADRIEEARQKRRDAEAQFARRQFAAAAATAEDGQRKLGMATPSPAVVKLYAELTFVLAQAHLGEREPAAAEAAFRLVSQLDPSFTPNAARTLPEVIAAFEAARRVAAGGGKLAVTGEGTVVVDGRELGPAPRGFDVPAGQHVVWLVGPDRDPRAKLVTVAAGRQEQVAIDDAPISRGKKVQRTRQELRAAPDASARAAAMRRLSVLLEVKDAILLMARNGELIVQTWRDRAPGFSRMTALGKRTPADLLEPLAPRPQPIVREEPLPEIPLPPEKPWYERPRYWALGSGLAVALIVGAVVAYRSWDRTVTLDPNGMNDQGARLR